MITAERIEQIREDRNSRVARERCALERAIRAGDIGYIQGFINGRFGVEVKEHHVALWIEKALRGQFGGTGWSESTWIMWLKNRLDEKGYLWSVSVGGRMETSIWLGCELHCFFINIYETPEMLEAMKANEDVKKMAEFSRNDEDGPATKLARSKISKTTLAEIFPIDSNAMGAVGKEFRYQE